MKKGWLWDLKISDSEARKILGCPDDRRFVLMASLLLARKADPGEVFKRYLDPLLFCRSWHKIKKKMSQDKWANPRIIFWQAIYEKLLERYRRRGVRFLRVKKIGPLDPLCETLGAQIQKIRKEKGLSQQELAHKIGVSQQLISRIEKGKENISLMTLKKISNALNKKIQIVIGP